MAMNRLTGETTFQVEGRTYTLKLTSNALCLLEDQFSTPTQRVSWLEILNRGMTGHWRELRGVLWASLRKHHPSITFEQAGDLMDALDPDVLKEAFDRLGDSARPDPEDTAALGQGRPRPPGAAGGTGNGSMGLPVA